MTLQKVKVLSAGATNDHTRAADHHICCQRPHEGSRVLCLLQEGGVGSARMEGEMAQLIETSLGPTCWKEEYILTSACVSHTHTHIKFKNQKES